MLVLAVLVIPSSALACEGTEDVGALVSALADGEEALAELDIAGFKAAVTRAEAVLACVSEPVPRHTAAQLHRLVGLRAFGERDPLAPAAFAAARRIEPAYTFPRTLVPPSSPVLEAWTAIAVEDLAEVPLAPPAEGWIEVDGRSGAGRVPELPAVFQRFAGDGSVATTGYLLPGEPPPAYAIAVTPPPAPVAAAADPRPWERARVPLAVTTGTAAATSGALWGLSLHGRARYVDTGPDRVADTELDGLRSRTNALAAGSAVGAGLAAVSGALLLTTW